jgi:hypothetical protein
MELGSGEDAHARIGLSGQSTRATLGTSFELLLSIAFVPLIKGGGEMTTVRALAGALAAVLVLASPAPAPGQKKPDLADMVQGSYAGDVISDARGSSQSDVGVIVTKVGRNSVSVASSYGRIPKRTFRLTRAMNTIQNVGGTEVFLLDLSQSPRKLDLTIDDASWSGFKNGAAIKLEKQDLR